MRLLKPAAAVVTCGIILSICLSASAACPTYTKKSAIIDSASKLAAGWFAYAKTGSKGLFKSDLKTFGEQLIPNTSNDQPVWTDISDDGNWILYRTPGANQLNSIYMIKPDGTGKTLIPTTLYLEASGGGYPGLVRFYRGSPLGNEIVFASGYGRLSAVSYTTNGAIVTPGSQRIVATFPADSTRANASSPWQYTWKGAIAYSEGMGLWKDEFFFESFVDNAAVSRPGYITIPDSGRGMATQANFFAWSNPPASDSSTYGCGNTMSHDGLFCASNAGWIGDSCVPCKNATQNGVIMDHKGFYVTNFFKAGSQAAFDIMTIPTQHGVSINWCPSTYWYGTYAQFDFDHENFSNDYKYVAIAQIGNGTNTKAALKGVWVVDWETNTWTLLTPSTNTLGSGGPTYVYPAVFFSNLAGVEQPRRATAETSREITAPRGFAAIGPSIELAAGVRGVTLYSLSGSVIWKCSRSDVAGSEKVVLPAAVQKSGYAVAKYEMYR